MTGTKHELIILLVKLEYDQIRGYTNYHKFFTAKYNLYKEFTQKDIVTILDTQMQYLKGDAYTTYQDKFRNLLTLY